MKPTSVLQIVALGLGLVSCASAQATDGAPVIIEGVVPDETTRAALVQRLRSIYGETQVMDRLQIAAVTTPANWSRYVTQAIVGELKEISKGQLTIDGNVVNVHGKVSSNEIHDRVQSRLKSAFNTTYEVHDDLIVDDTNARQALLDRTLASRTVQFETGSAVLTPQGLAVLDDMAAAITRVGVPQLDIVGHTDSVGDRQANILLSVQRADAVKAYLTARGIDAQRMVVGGRGPDLPVADNGTPAGRARNRRIEFVIRRS
ncbi:OmpA family protein [Luteibacter sp. 22Crub2.1]|uniref:OmpA family protein n=1 Tax=Luteibacter sp. 22Crub2.1 TaxID=1283288 RepID=UPI001590FF5E|nr:OmpA family protein [Luteibacter sp. 22Crub2.1]